MRKLRNVAVCAGGLLLALARSASAQPPPPGPPPVDAGDGTAPLRREVWEQLRTMRVWRMTQELKLDEAQIAKLFPVLGRFDERERELAQQRGELMRALRQASDAAKPNATEIAKLIDQARALHSRKVALDDERFQALRKLLSPVQQARLVLLWPRIDEPMRRRMREALEGDRPGRPEGVADRYFEGRPGER